MATIHPDQIKAAESVLRQYIPDQAISAAGAFLEALGAYLDAAPAQKTRAARAARDEPEGFADFYAIFPRKVERRGASNAYRSALTRSTPEIILAGAKRYAAAMAGTEMKYVKHPATWLNQDCWLDEMGALTLVGGATAVFEDGPIGTWVKRLEAWTGRTEQPKGSWRPSWGPKPREEGCKVPESAKTAYLKIYPPKTQDRA